MEYKAASLLPLPRLYFTLKADQAPQPAPLRQVSSHFTQARKSVLLQDSRRRKVLGKYLSPDIWSVTGRLYTGVENQSELAMLTVGWTQARYTEPAPACPPHFLKQT